MNVNSNADVYTENLPLAASLAYFGIEMECLRALHFWYNWLKPKQ